MVWSKQYRKLTRSGLSSVVSVAEFPKKLWGINSTAKYIAFASLIGVTAASSVIYNHAQYSLSKTETKLLSRSSVDNKLIKETATEISYNRSAEKSEDAKKLVVASAADATGKQPFKAVLSKDSSKGIIFSDEKGDLSFTMTPTFSTANGRSEKARVIYPEGLNTTDIYTFKRNGIKEDIILSKAPGNTFTRSWKFDLGTKLEAKLLPNGSIGIFSADPSLFGDITISDEKSQKLIDVARKKGDKTSLAFIIPAPNIKDAKGNTSYKDTSFKLSGNILTLEARNLKHKTYPISIDPSVIVTTNADFAKGSDDGMISYPGAGNISRSDISAGVIGGFVTTSSFTAARYGHSTVAYNGYLYVIGGFDGTTYYATVQYAPILADGTVGAWTATTSFATARYTHTSVVYNGYLYVIGGNHGISDTACNGTAAHNIEVSIIG